MRTILIAGLIGMGACSLAHAQPLDEAKCIIGAASLVPKSSAMTINGARIVTLAAGESKRYPMAPAWVDVDVSAFDRRATYRFMCGTNSDGGTAVQLMR